MKVEVSKRPVYSVSNGGLSIPGAQPSKLWINDELIWTAGGGAGQVNSNIAPTGVDYVQIQCGNGTSEGAWSTSIPVHWHSGSSTSGGGCYTVQNWRGTRIARCPGRYHTDGTRGYDWCPSHGDHCHIWNARCDTCGHVTGFCNDVGSGYSCACDQSFGTQTVHYTGYKQQSDDVFTGWSVGCGYDDGEIRGYNNASYVAGQCYYKTDYAPSAYLTRTGDGLFSIKLAEQETVYYKNVVASNPYYTDGRVDLAILDNTVCYYKRR